MRIHGVSQTERKAVVSLSSEELVDICNALHNVEDERRNERFLLMYVNFQNARDLSIYGHLDIFSLEYALNCKKQADKRKRQKQIKQEFIEE